MSTLSIPAGPSSTLFSYTISPGPGLVTPAPGTILWAGLAFDDNNGSISVSASQLNNLGQGVYDPPTVGSSGDQIFNGTTAFDVNNPPGSVISFGQDPIANLGWRFTTAIAVPEPMTWALIGFGAIGSISYGIRYRRKLRAQFEEKFSINKKTA